MSVEDELLWYGHWCVNDCLPASGSMKHHPMAFELYKHVVRNLPGHAAGAAAKGRKTLRKQLGAEVRKQFGIGILAWLLGWGLSALAQAIIEWILGRLTTDKAFGAACQAYRMASENGGE